MAPAEPKATVILFAGGHGGLQITGEDSFKWGKGNFLIRSRDIFKDQGLLVIVVMRHLIGKVRRIYLVFVKPPSM